MNRTSNRVTPQRIARLTAWCCLHAALFLATVAATGVIVFWFAATSSVFFTVWMFTPFVRRSPVPTSTQRSSGLRILAAFVGSVPGLLTHLFHPLYIAATVILVPHAFLLVNRHNIGYVGALLTTGVAALSLALLSHGAVTPLIVDPSPWLVLAGYAGTFALFVMSLILADRDDQQLGFEGDDRGWQHIGLLRLSRWPDSIRRGFIGQR